jgi:hypothetical protein
MKDVFISYNSPKREMAQKILAHLEKRGFPVFLTNAICPAVKAMAVR